MAEVETSGPDFYSEWLARGNVGTFADMLNSVFSRGTSFVANGQYMTLAQLLSSFPASSAVDGMYANVSNLFNGTSTSATGGVKEVVRCRYDAANNQYRWVPQRLDFNMAMPMTGGTVTLMPLVTPPTIRLVGTLAGNLNILPDATNAWVGLRWRTVQNSTLGLFTTAITNLIGSNITLMGNTQRDVDYGSTGYYAT
jgi:hypothetical protein